MSVPEKVQEKYSLLLRKGDEKLYRHIIGYGVLNRARHDFPEIVYLNQSEAFFALFRQTGNEKLFIIGKILRRAAHRLHRHYQRSYDDRVKDARFLGLVE